MKLPHPFRSPAGIALHGAAVFLLPAWLAAQNPLDVKPTPTPDPVKGWADPSPLTSDELQTMRTQRPPHTPLPAGAELPRGFATASGTAPGRVFHDTCDGALWVMGDRYKASFGADGFTYVPWFGASAPRNFPVQFVLRTVQVGGQPLVLADAAPQRAGDRITFARGAVAECYDLTAAHVEQTFVVDTTLPGDVVLTLDVVSELAEDPATPGIQFGNELGCVNYGQAHVVDGERLVPVATTCDGNAIRIVVPATARTAGPLVIDPVIYTSAFLANLAGDSSQPDIAYDATWDMYLLVWQHPFSANDYDIYTEFRYGSDGSPLTGSIDTVDYTGANYMNPRVANLAAGDRFLVVAQRFIAGKWEIYGRLRLAGQGVHPNIIPISDPSFGGHCINPDIGGDPAETGTADNWLVVWQRELSTTDYDIHGRIVRIDTAMPAGPIMIENTGASIYSMPSVSQSNGNGFATAARWMVVYQYRFSATDQDIYGCSLNQAGAIAAANQPVDTSTANDLVPTVSSPNTTAASGNPLFLVTYERQNPFDARARLLSAQFVNQIPPVNLTQAFGLGGFWVRAESDGNRFAVLNGAAGISVATLAYTGSALVLQEAPQPLPTAPAYARLCSKRSGGGSVTDYGIAFIDTNWAPDRIGVSAYRGHTPGAETTRRVMGCGNLQITATGRPFLGESLLFQLANVGFDIPGFAFGMPVPATNVLCAPCPIGVSLNGVTVLLGASLSITIPTSIALVDYTAAVQGLAFGSGPCVASLRFADTIDFSVR
jgi:hypothetical protein